jgi:SnoaL-like polyketide cyclase
VARFHKPDVVVYWPGQPPTRGMEAHRAEARALFKTFPDQHLDNRPYKTLFGSGDWTCSIARFTGTMMGPMVPANGTEIPPTGKSFELEFCAVARWDKRPDGRGEPLLRPGRSDAPARLERLAPVWGIRRRVRRT